MKYDGDGACLYVENCINFCHKKDAKGLLNLQMNNNNNNNNNDDDDKNTRKSCKASMERTNFCVIFVVCSWNCYKSSWWLSFYCNFFRVSILGYNSRFPLLLLLSWFPIFSFIKTTSARTHRFAVPFFLVFPVTFDTTADRIMSTVELIRFAVLPC